MFFLEKELFVNTKHYVDAGHVKIDFEELTAVAKIAVARCMDNTSRRLNTIQTSLYNNVKEDSARFIGPALDSEYLIKAAQELEKSIQLLYALDAARERNDLTIKKT